MPQFTPEEIEYSRRLDVWKWSDFPEINNLVQEVYAMFFVHMYSRKDAVQRAKNHLKVLLIDLYLAFLDDPKLTIGLPMYPGAYTPRSIWRSIHVTSMIIPIVKQAAKVGLLELWTGNEIQKRVSRVRPTATLKKLFKKSLSEGYYFELQNSLRPPIIFRRSKDKHTNYLPHEVPNLKEQDMTQLARTAGVIIEYNARINSAYIDIPDLNGKKLKVSKSGRQVTYLHLSQSNKHIQQIYNDFSMYSGGRFYGGFWQGMPKPDRARLYINDEPTIELDYSGMHINALYSLAGNSRYESKDDPYMISLPRYNLTNEDRRRLAKQITLIALNAENETIALNAIRNWIRTEENIYKALPNLADVTIKPILNALKVKHEKISDAFCTGICKTLMNLDALIMEQIIETSLELHILILPIHDSIIVQKKHFNTARKMMQDAYTNIMQDNIGISTTGNQTGIKALTHLTTQRTKRYKANLSRWKARKAMFHYPKSYEK